jgi:hypothetical protein
VNPTDHVHEQLGGYLLGVLDRHERRGVEEHLTWCAACRAEATDLNVVATSLAEVPPEAFLDGPPQGGDLMLQRTLRAVRGERVVRDHRRLLLAAASVVAVIAAALGGGVLIGRNVTDGTVVRAAPSTPPSSSAPVPGSHTFTGTNPDTGARMSAAVIPAAGWVRIRAHVDGVAAGRRCQLMVVSRQGERVLAGSWVVSAAGERAGTALEGSALVAPDDVAALEVVTVEGDNLITVPA